uniref:Leukotriene B4 receptor n=1 Tax=Neogobius melanostomus TaxID=47308 RepID=A0A8C6WGY8_9GOBI
VVVENPSFCYGLQHKPDLSPHLTLCSGGIAILTLAFLLGFPGNLFVVWSVFCKVKKRSVTCILVLNLAIADAFVLLSAPLFLRFLAGGRGWEFGSAACKLVHYLCSVNMYVSIYLICLMSLDRWLAVTRPFLSQRLRTKPLEPLLHITPKDDLWVILGLILDLLFVKNERGGGLYFRIVWHMGHKVFQYMFETVMGCIIPFTLINTCYSSVICRLQSAMFQQRAQGSRLILFIILAFAVFWVPYHIVNIIEVTPYALLPTGPGSASTRKAARTARPNVTAFAFFSSAVNPILYVFAGSSHIRKAGLSFMGKLFEATNSESRSTSTFMRSRSSAPDESTVLQSLSIKLGRPFKSRGKERNESVRDEREEGEPELKTLATVQVD